MTKERFSLLARKSWRTPVIVLLGVAMLFLISLADYYTGYEISFSIFYLLPILFVLLLTEQKILTFVFCVISAAVWLSADIASGQVYSHSFIPYWNMFVRLVFFSVISWLLLMQRALIKRAEKLSMIDPITNIGNARYFYRSSNEEMQRAIRYARPMTFVYFDIDDFKLINDRFGHSKGDRLLQSVAAAVSTTIRKTDIFGRLGGDEFAVLMPEISCERARQALERVQTILLEVMKKEGYSVTFSFGVATFSKPLASVDEMIKTADHLMYKSKESGKNKISAAGY